MKREMSEELWGHLLTLARLLLDARTAAAGVKRQATIDEYNTGKHGTSDVASWRAAEEAAQDFDLTLDIGALRERVRILMAQIEEQAR